MILRMLRAVAAAQNKCSFNGIFDFEALEIWMMPDVNKELVIDQTPNNYGKKTKQDESSLLPCAQLAWYTFSIKDHTMELQLQAFSG